MSHLRCLPLSALLLLLLLLHRSSAAPASNTTILEVYPTSNSSQPKPDLREESAESSSYDDDDEDWNELGSGDLTFQLQLRTNDTQSSETIAVNGDDKFTVRLARALKHMNYGRLPKTIVLNPREVIEHTHVEEEPSLLPEDPGYFADAAGPQPKPAQPKPAPAAPAKGKSDKRAAGVGAETPILGQLHGPARCDPGKNNYFGPVIVISNVRDLQVVNPRRPDEEDAEDAEEEDERDDDPAGAELNVGAIKQNVNNGVDINDII